MKNTTKANNSSVLSAAQAAPVAEAMPAPVELDPFPISGLADAVGTVDEDLDIFNEGGDLLEQQLEAAGFRRIQWFHENHTYHRGAVVELGGFGIKNESGQAPNIGPTQAIKHLNGNTTQFAVANALRAALIGFSQPYWVLECDDPIDPDKRRIIYLENYVDPKTVDGNKAKCRKGISLFVVLDVDGDRELYELSLRGHIVEDAAKLILGAKREAAEYKADRKIGGTVHIFAFWHTLTFGESRMVGKEEQSIVTPPIISNNTPAAQRRVGREDYLKFIELRKELDAFLATGRYKGADARQQLAAPAGVAQLAAPEPDMPF